MKTSYTARTEFRGAGGSERTCSANPVYTAGVYWKMRAFVMPKMKTNKAAAKRFKGTGGSRIKRGAAYRRHLLSHKSRTQKRQLRSPQSVDRTSFAHIEKLLPYL